MLLDADPGAARGGRGGDPGQRRTGRGRHVFHGQPAATSRSTASKISAPYRFKVIGKPQDLEPALNIPGGVVQTLEKEQATRHGDRVGEDRCGCLATGEAA